MENEKEIKVNISADGTVGTNLDTTPNELPPVEDIIINLGFWLDMLRQVAPRVLKSKLNGVPKPEQDKE